ncbi:MAG: hypothetical protein IPO90_10540 [Flavobacteriales bacterium]|nr:hypothetical protein [Flavobacteriales bacterium]
MPSEAFAAARNRMATVPTSGYETDPDRMDWITVYQDKAYLNYLAGALVYFSAERFKGANIIKKLGELEAIQRHIAQKIVTLHSGGQAIIPFLMDWLIDEIRICLFFENLMKAELLDKGFLIHYVNDPTQKSSKAAILRKEQKDRPIPSSRLVTDGFTNAELQSKTLTMDLMFRPKYQAVIGIPSDVLVVVRRMNENRNKLHFTSEVGGELSSKGGMMRSCWMRMSTFNLCGSVRIRICTDDSLGTAHWTGCSIQNFGHSLTNAATSSFSGICFSSIPESIIMLVTALRFFTSTFPSTFHFTPPNHSFASATVIP